ncbi:titin-like [Tropilaelaps mercedesae]|uniref:Titin-like n=1 Tax=Tropilaelaps mercedesae TaxID=418985 RepID=A0A1V9Y1P4_9ACAR|nr:titin-like [Tropilaelaps mercedesae]
MVSKRVKTGRTVTFTCALSEGEDVTFSWSRKGVLLRKTGRIDIVFSGVMSSLSVRNVQPDDAGTYVCVGRNAASEQKVSATLTVEGYIKLRKLQQTTTNTGEAIAFTCTALKGTDVTFAWTKNGHLLTSSKSSGSSKFAIMTNKKTSVLTIEDVRQDDVGNYTCAATNSFAEDQTSALLTVEGIRQAH